MNDALRSYDDAAVMEGQARFALDKKLLVKFYVKAVRNEFKSNQEGRPIYDEVDYVRIITPGNQLSIVDTKVTREHSEVRFSDQYRKFKSSQSQARSGTPLEVWPQMTVGQVAELKAMNIETVEDLAELDDVLAQRIMGNHDLRRRAKAFLEAAAGEAANSKLAHELEKRDNEIALLNEKINQLIAATAAANTAKVAAPVSKEK